ncbi:hemicentin-2-like isoform X2 [Etheostoma cragini]|uniref:hemicentin-2-like isoform X2 n=1 Tax=Etheostoma cragini TaxID=417921 RepID=UPI00155E6CB2|nr:hemicentin-2-like isoform X2 [Etheostoma cragini]
MVMRRRRVVQTVCSTMDPPSACLLLFLTCLAGFSASETENSGTMGDISYGPSSLEIDGVDVVTVGIPYGFQCMAECYPDCRYSWIRGDEITQGPELSLQLLQIVSTQTLTCTVVNPETGRSASVQKTLQVTAGPSNVQISGPAFLTAGVASNFTCSADCYPSCSYSWIFDREWERFSTTQGNTISVTPPAGFVGSDTLICKAQDTASNHYIYRALQLQVASLFNINIAGASAVAIGKMYTFTCYATCSPSCVFTWTFMGTTYEGDQLQITISDYSKTGTLTCEATNNISHATISATKNLTVIDPFSVRPGSQALPVAGGPFSLQCVGPQDPASITWFKNEWQMTVSNRVHFSPDNTTMTFTSLLREDDGVYKCLVVETGNLTTNPLVALEGGTPILSFGYLMQVNYGPDEVLIVKPDKQSVGEMMFTQPGSTTELQCSTDCFPACSINWFYRGSLLATNASILFTPVTPPYENTLTCIALNPVTKKNRTAETTVVVPDGPRNVIIKGPDTLEIGVTASFTCSAECTPSCSFKWTLYGKTVTGSGIDITVNRQVSEEPISCQAENTFTGKTVIVHQTLSVSDPHWCGC